MRRLLLAVLILGIATSGSATPAEALPEKRLKVSQAEDSVNISNSEPIDLKIENRANSKAEEVLLEISGRGIEENRFQVGQLAPKETKDFRLSGEHYNSSKRNLYLKWNLSAIWNEKVKVNYSILEVPDSLSPDKYRTHKSSSLPISFTFPQTYFIQYDQTHMNKTARFDGAGGPIESLNYSVFPGEKYSEYISIAKTQVNMAENNTSGSYRGHLIFEVNKSQVNENIDEVGLIFDVNYRASTNGDFTIDQETEAENRSYISAISSFIVSVVELFVS
jgi:hypothetical protein